MNDKQKSGKIRRMLIAIGGGFVLVIGIITIPYPGPGWLIVFAGLAILSTEFAWAGRALGFGRKQYDRWNAWIKRQGWFVRSLTFIATSIIVIVTLWLINAYGLTNDFFNLGLDWIRSPLPIFH